MYVYMYNILFYFNYFYYIIFLWENTVIPVCPVMYLIVSIHTLIQQIFYWALIIYVPGIVQPEDTWIYEP